jgi:hypothetical protein
MKKKVILIHIGLVEIWFLNILQNQKIGCRVVGLLTVMSLKKSLVQLHKLIVSNVLVLLNAVNAKHKQDRKSKITEKILNNNYLKDVQLKHVMV